MFLVVGNTISWGVKVYDENGQLADLGGGSPTATVTLPDGTTAAATVTKVSTGVYRADYTSTQPGRHRVTWVGSGTNSGNIRPHVDIADVKAADPRLIVSVADARAALNDSNSTIPQPELENYIAATTEVIESITGPVLPRSITEIHSGDGTTALRLYNYPTAITSVTEDGTTLSASTQYALGEGGVLWRRTGTWSTAYAGNITVVYTVGVPDGIIPDNILLAAREQVRFLYQIGQTAARPALGTEQAPGSYMPMGFAVPHRVVELLAQYKGAYGGMGGAW